MVTLSHSDIRALFFGVAQLMPVFLIALFVMDNSWIINSAKRIKSDAQTGIDQAKELIKRNESELKSTIEDGLRQIDAYDEGLDTPQVRARLDEIRAKTLSSGNEMLERDRSRQGATLGKLTSRVDEIVATMEASAKKRASTYARIAILAIIPGMLAEVASLWGAIGLVNSITVIAFAISISVGIAGILSLLAIDRLIDQAPSRPLAFLRAGWIVMLFGITLTTFFWIVFSVKIEH